MKVCNFNISLFLFPLLTLLIFLTDKRAESSYRDSNNNKKKDFSINDFIIENGVQWWCFYLVNMSEKIDHAL
jgi:hypothetical protein